MFVPVLDNMSDFEEPFKISGMWQCSICTHENTTYSSSCELCGVLHDLSLYFNDISEDEDGAKCRHKYSGVSILARSLFTPPSAKSKAIVFSHDFKDRRNTTGNKQATMDALHKTFMTRKKRHINIVDTEVLVKDSVGVTGKEMMNNDILLTEKNTSMDPSALVQLDDGGTSSNVPSSSQNITLALDHELQHLSLESKLKNSKTNVKKTASVSHYKPEPWMLQSENQEIRNQLSLAIVGHVDSGKSTLCGRLRHALGLISKKQMHKYEKEAKEKGKGSFAYAWAMDESSDERERGITMTVAVAYFNSEKYRVVLLDSPGHKDFVPNMISGATQADAAILVVDASIGSFEAGMGVNGIGQTKEHSQLVRSFGVENLIVAVNKMDGVEYSKERFQSVKSQLGVFLRSCGYKDSSVTWVPLSAMANENLVTACSDTRLLSWYNGGCLLQAIDSLPPPRRDVSSPLRLPICDVIASHTLGQVAVCGKVESGGIRTGCKVLVMPSGDIATVKTMERDSSTCSLARAGDNVAVGLHGVDPGHIAAGGVLCHPDFPVRVACHLELKILVLEITVPILVGLEFELHIRHAKSSARLVRILSSLDQKTGRALKKAPRLLTARQAALVEVRLDREACVEEFSTLKALARVFLRSQGSTVAVGVVTRVLDRALDMG
ncbi:HBS1-like protein isoform X3 [Zea mays]|uniref:Translation elongation factor EF1A/initiation factor IF2gamma family protein n=3 Tax=Zea mays TaxID=4577 RepID=A0A1D6DT72_MAIZE|nr:HBS1-like protein isoform X3 [Zea mays]ONM12082.1 Translation elongation factor EF1A/initiation factor IF2gamma family protein [Zea mays]|eukprot:XP_008668685.1 HBS1-like protein isoform X3 [Zea mays]